MNGASLTDSGMAFKVTELEYLGRMWEKAYVNWHEAQSREVDYNRML